MSVECFLDANIVVYAAAGRGREETKRKRALDLIEKEDFGLRRKGFRSFT
jgi:predicted nucleic acid-binding protein